MVRAGGYQEQDGKEAVEYVVPVGQVAFPSEGKDLHAHFKQVVKDEAQVDDLSVGQWKTEVSSFMKLVKVIMLTKMQR